MLRNLNCERVISKGFWPPRSPDLTPPDIFLSSYFKGNVYINRPHTLNELKRHITTEIIVGVLLKAAANMVKRVRACTTEQGSHFEHGL